MNRSDFDLDWQKLAEESLTGMKEWRLQHPKATFKEIETALDERLNALRARMLSDVSAASTAAEWGGGSKEERPRCPECGHPLSRRGRKRRTLQTQGGQEVVLERQYGVCPSCGTGLFPPG